MIADRQRRQERTDLGGSHLCGMSLVVEEDESADPVDVDLFGSTAVVARSDRLADAVEKSGLRRSESSTFATDDATRGRVLRERPIRHAAGRYRRLHAIRE